MSHAPELVAALVGAEGANLAWLGVMLQKDHGKTVGSKDTMHFELRPADYPALPGGRYPDVIRGGPGASRPAQGDFPSPDEADSA
jgi:hypothetical protein